MLGFTKATSLGRGVAVALVSIVLTGSGPVRGDGLLSTVRITVKDAVTGRPLPHVELSAGSAGRGRTSERGIATLSLPTSMPSAIEVVTKPDGYMRFAAFSVPLTITPSQDIHDVDFLVYLTGDMSGTVKDEAGKPVSGASVHAVTTEYTSVGPFTQREEALASTLQRFSVKDTITDATGGFRLTQLRAGQGYRILVIPAVEEPLLPTASAPGPHYFPSATNWSDAQVINVSSNENRTGLDVTLRSREAGCIVATAARLGRQTPVLYDALPSDLAGLRQYGATANPAWIRAVQGDSAGGGRLCGLPAGKYEVRATDSFSDLGAYPSAKQTVAVSAGAVTEVQMYLRQPVPANVETIALKESDAAVPGVFLWPPSLARSIEGTSWTANPITEFAVQIQDLPLNASISHVLVNGARVNTGPVSVSGDSFNVQVHLAPAATLVVAPPRARGDGLRFTRWLALVPDAPTLDENRLALVRVVATDGNSSTTIYSVRPGEYRLIELATPPLHWVYRPTSRVHVVRTPEFAQTLQNAVQHGTRISLSAGENKATFPETEQ